MTILFLDDMKLLSTEEKASLQLLSQDWPFTVQIITAEVENRGQLDRLVATTSKPNMISIGVASNLHETTILVGSDIKLSPSDLSEVLTIGESSFKNGKVAAGIEEVAGKAASKVVKTQEVQPVQEAPLLSPVAYTSLSLALVLAVVASLLWWRNRQERRFYMYQVKKLDHEIAERKAESFAIERMRQRMSASTAFTPPSIPPTLAVPKYNQPKKAKPQ